MFWKFGALLGGSRGLARGMGRPFVLTPVPEGQARKDETDRPQEGQPNMNWIEEILTIASSGKGQINGHEPAKKPQSYCRGDQHVVALPGPRWDAYLTRISRALPLTAITTPGMT